MLLQRATADDIAGICAIERKYGQFITIEDETTHRARLSDPAFLYLVMRDDEGVAGYVMFVGVNSPSRNVELRRIAVRTPEQKIGRPMMQQAVHIAFTELKAHRLWLDVAEHNLRAQNLYRSLCFVQEGMMREAHLHEGQWISLILMSLLEQEYAAPEQS